MYPRLLELPIGKKSFFLFGPRQTGKSTLISSHLKNRPHLSINLLERDSLLLYKSRPLTGKKTGVFTTGAPPAGPKWTW